MAGPRHDRRQLRFAAADPGNRDEQYLRPRQPYPSESHPNSKYFAVARLKPLTPSQLATSLKIAASDPAAFSNLKPDEFEKKIEQVESASRGFASSIAVPTDDFMIGANEALLFSNNPRIQQEFLSEGGGSLLAKVKDMKDVNQTVDLIVRSTLGRPPTDEEKQLLGEYLSKRGDRPVDGCRQVIWALITGSEFRFNH